MSKLGLNVLTAVSRSLSMRKPRWQSIWLKRKVWARDERTGSLRRQARSSYEHDPSLQGLLLKLLLRPLVVVSTGLTGLLSQADQNHFQSSTSLNGRQRLSVDSGWYCDSRQRVDFLATYNGWDLRQHKRIRTVAIKEQLLKNIADAQNMILASFFLFDNMYSLGSPESKVTDEVVAALIKKKKQNPNIKVAIILDPLNRAYSRRIPPALKMFEEHGIDVFFSDLLQTKAATRLGIIESAKELGEIASEITGGAIGSVAREIGSRINFCSPGISNGFLDFSKNCLYDLDGHSLDLEMIFEATTLKANHRKVLVTDSPDGFWRAVVSSANPHNASDDSTNTALSVRAQMAKYIYNNLREDIRFSLNKESKTPINLGNKYSRKYAWLSHDTEQKYPKIFDGSGRQATQYLTEEFPPRDVDLKKGNNKSGVCTKYITEIEIKNEILEQLAETDPEDIVRIQMFYLSDKDVVTALTAVANQPGREVPVMLLLDPSKDAFNSIKDGTPNRQVGHFLMTKSDKLMIRWYATHGEQNHAKAMSITNPRAGKYIMMTGSANWTGKNLNDVNMESNLIVRGSKKVTHSFNKLFDTFWFNSERGILYSWDYDAYDLRTTTALNLGYRDLENYSNSELPDIASRHQSRVAKHFFDLIEMSGDQDRILSSFSDNQKSNWAVRKAQRDSSTTLRALSYLQGRYKLSKMSEEQIEKIEEKYMRQWINGEKWGYVSW